ncbi:MAG: alanine racemase [Bryobacteraceae bacterium]|nr:alanine racemase [Bryobacteraceae bacterium]
MISRRTVCASLIAGPALSAAADTKRYASLEARFSRGDLRDIHKEDLPTPAMVVDLDLFESNVKKMAEHCRAAGIQLRSHVKVHKSTDIAKRQVASGANGLTCATVAECELMAGAGLTGILLTRQPAGKNNIHRVVALAKREPTFATVVDDPLVADWLQDCAAAEKTTVRTVVDVFAGLKRHGIEAGQPAIDLAKHVDRSKNLKLAGWMGYSGIAAHVPGWPDRKARSLGDLAGLRETVRLAKAAGLPVEVVTGGSTGTYNIDSETKDLTELQAGSYVFMDTLYKVIGGKRDPKVYDDFAMALTVLSTVVSARHPKLCTIDAGNKALLRTTDEVKGHPRMKVINQGAEYGGITWEDGDQGFKLGDRVEIYPSNLDMSTNCYDRYYVARGEKIVDIWPIMGRSGAAQR